MAGLDKWIYNFARRRKIPWIGLTGETLSSVSCLLKDSLNKIVLCSGTTVPTNATTGFAKGCFFVKTDAATKISGIYINVGTSTSCVFLQLSKAPFLNIDATVAAQAASATLTTSSMGKNLTNTGASGTVALTLPDVAAAAGMCGRVYLTVAQIVQLVPASGQQIFLGGSGVANKYVNIAAVIGNYVDFYSDGTYWYVTGYSGVVTKQA